MRRLLVIVLALGLLLVAPATASAHDEHVDIVLHAEYERVGFTDDGGEVYYGPYTLYDGDGNLIEYGYVTATVHATAGGQQYTATAVYVNVYGDIVETKSAGHVVGLAETDDGIVVDYVFGETITYPPYLSARLTGVVTVYVNFDGTATGASHAEGGLRFVPA